MDELDVTSEEEEEEEGEAEGETEGDEMEDEMTDVWWKTCPYCSLLFPFLRPRYREHEAQKNKDPLKSWAAYHPELLAWVVWKKRFINKTFHFLMKKTWNNDDEKVTKMNHIQFFCEESVWLH